MVRNQYTKGVPGREGLEVFSIHNITKYRTGEWYWHPTFNAAIQIKYTKGGEIKYAINGNNNNIRTLAIETDAPEPLITQIRGRAKPEDSNEPPEATESRTKHVTHL